MSDGMDVQARLRSDNSNFDENFKKSAQIAKDTQEGIKRGSREVAAAQALAAKLSGEAISEQSRIAVAAFNAQKDAGKEYRQVLSAIKAGHLEGETAINSQVASYQKLAAARVAVAEATKVQEHAEVSQRMAASAAVRGLRDGNVGIRSVENFVTTIPGVGAALQGIFPILGGVAFIAMLGEMAAKIVEIKKEAELLARKLADAFRDEHLSVAMATDELRLHNDELQNQINKLEHKPQNNLLIELDANVLAMDRMAKGAIEAQKRVKELLETNKVGQLAQFMGHDSTAVVAGSVNAYRQDIADLSFQKSEQTRAGNRAGAEETQRLLDAKKASYAKWLNDQIDMRTGTVAGSVGQTGRNAYSLIHGSQGENLAILKGERINLRDENGAEAEAARTGPLESRKLGLESSKALGEQQRKADELRLKQMETDLASIHLLHSRTIKEDEEFWDGRQNLFELGSAQYNAIVDKQAQLLQESIAKVTERVNKIKGEQKRAAEETGRIGMEVVKGMTLWNADDRKVWNERVDASNEANAQAARNAAKMAELQINERISRSITSQDAAIQLAAVHTSQYGAEVFRLSEELKRAQAEPATAEQQKKVDELKAKIDAQHSARALEMQSDAYRINPPDSSAVVGAKDAIAEFTRQALDSAALMKSILSNTLSEVNKTLVEELTSRSRQGPRHLWTNLGKDTAKNITGFALERGEGVLLKGLGLSGNKAPKGTASDPLFVKMVQNANSAAGGLLNKLGGVGKDSDSSDSGNGDSGGFWKSAGSALLSAVPFLASGTNYAAGGPAWVGEEGPELVNLPRGASVIPHGRAISMTAGSGMHFSPTIHVTGNADPAQMMAYVHAGLKQAMPVYLHAARADQADRKRRKTGRA